MTVSLTLPDSRNTALIELKYRVQLTLPSRSAALTLPDSRNTALIELKYRVQLTLTDGER